MICRSKPVIKVVSFVIDFEAVDRIVDRLKLQFAAAKPPPLRVFEQVALAAAASACTHGDVFAAP